MKLITWNLAGRNRMVDDQVAALVEQSPDIVALQEVTVHSEPELRKRLAQSGLSHAVDGFTIVPTQKRPRKYRQLVASRFPIHPLEVAIPVPWPEAVLATVLKSPRGDVEIFNCHIPPGSSYAWKKVETFEGLFTHLSHQTNSSRILCGDFNTPQAERPDGTVITWGQRICDDGDVVIRNSIRGGPGKRWDAAERSVLTQLAHHDLADVFRQLHGYSVEEFSWRLSRHGRHVHRRFDHVFASASLKPSSARYLHDCREAGWSDHSPLEVEFVL